MTQQETFDPSSMINDVTARDFDAVVAKSDIPVLVDFWAPWCGPCQQIAPVLEALVAHYPGKLRVAKVNVDEETTLAIGFGVRSIPMLLLFKDGKVAEEIIGLHSPEDLVKKIGPHLSKPANKLRKSVQDALLAQDYETALPLLQQALAEEPNNAGILVDIVRAQLALSQADDAAQTLAQLPETLKEEPEIQKLKHEIVLAQQTSGGDAPDTLLAQLNDDPDNLELRHKLAKAYVAARDYPNAMEQFFELMKADRAFENDAGRDGLLSVFGALGGDDAQVQNYRRKMASLLH